MARSGESRSGWRWIVLGTLTLLVLFFALLVSRWRAPEEESGRSGLIAPTSLDAPGKRSPDHTNPGPTRKTVAGAAVTDDLCGVSGSDQVRNEGETVEQHVARLTDKAIGHWKTALLESGNPRQHAVGLALGNASPGVHGFTYEAPDTAANNDLVLLAMETNDPAIYALALGQCGEGNWDMAAGPCQGLSLEHWTQIDPDNALPWLLISSRADKAGDYLRADEALSRAARASRLQTHIDALAALALDRLPPEAPPLEKAVAGADLISIARLGSPIALVTLCSEEALQAATRKERCSSITNLLATQGSNLIDAMLAAILGKRLGWPEDKWMALQRESDSDRRALTYPWSQVDPGEGFRCAKLLRYDYYVEQLAAHGGSERAALKAITETPRTVDAPAQ